MDAPGSATSEAAGSGPGLGPAQRRRSLAAIIACISIYGVVLGLTSPLLSLILEARGVDSTIIGLNAATPALAMLLVSPFTPAIIRAVGFRLAILASLAVEGVVLLLFPAFPGLIAWFGLRFILGGSGVLLFIAAETWINQVASEATRGRVVAIYVTAVAAGLALGPLIVALAGIEGWAPFLIGAAVVGVSMLPLAAAGNVAPSMDGRASFGVLGFVRRAPTLTGAVIFFGFLIMSQLNLLPVYGVRHAMDAGTAAAMLMARTLGNVILQAPIGWAADRFERQRVLLLCALVVLAGSLLLPLAIRGGPWLWVLLFVWGGFGFGIYTVAMTILGERFRGGELVTANAAFSVLWALAQLVGPPLSGWAMDLWDPEGLPAVFALAALAFVALWLLRARGPWRRPKA